MKRLLFLCFALACAAGTLAAQEEVSPFAVDTLLPTPTVVKTAEPFTITYRVRYLDLANTGKEIVVLRNQMSDAAFAPFEVVKIDASDKRKNGGEYEWNFKYTLRIIGLKKGDLRVPKIPFYWAIRTVGSNPSDAANADVKTFETEAVPIMYVTTLTKKTPLYVRDAMQFGNAEREARLLKAASGTIVLALFAGFLFFLRRFVRRMRGGATGKSKDASDDSIMIERDDVSFRNELRALTKLTRNPAEGDEWRRMIEKRIFDLMRSLIMLEVPKARRSHTPRELAACVGSAALKGKRKEVLAAITARLAVMEVRMDSGESVSSEELRFAVKRIGSAYRSLWLRRWFR
ncbi:MAG TPA: hypothetical protein VNG29_02260 [Candidatus Paceibacterota bacterium]|nr:hypothetical protein [Candidatus Paceibacterota bacterium]